MDRPDLPEDLEVYVDSLDEQGRVTYISGYFVFRRIKLRFGAIGMEGYGGPNIAATLTDETIAELRRLGLDDRGVDELITAVQRKIMEGQAHIQLKGEEKTPETDKDAHTQGHSA
ncbi:MAG TPA: hypothetical protein VED86_01380 [archaeon]|nr:hypothetical protein [archaeon]